MQNSILKWLSSVTGKYKLHIILLAILQGILGGSSVLYAMLLRNTIDSAAVRNKAGFWLNLWLVIGLVAAQILLRAVVRWLEESSRSAIENIYKSRLFEVLLKKDYAAVTDTHSGEWLNRLTSDTQVTANGMIEILPGILGMAVKMIGALVMLLIIEPKFLYVLIPGGAALIVLTYAFRRVLKRLHKAIQENDGSLRVFLQERLGSLMIVRTFSAEKQSVVQANEKMADHRRARLKRNHFSNVCNIGFSAAMNGMYLLGLGYCGLGIIGGTVSYGTLTAVLQLISQIQSPFANITGYLPKFYAMTASAERLREAEQFADDCTAEPKSKDEIQHFYDTDFAGISLKNICFRYKSNDRESVLHNLDLDIQKGQYIAFSGHSGCGKSTVLKLMMCLYHSDSGEMLLKKADGTAIPLTSQWHRLFAYVPQGNQLMSGTIREVIAFGDTERMHDTDGINRALQISCADDFVQELESGVDTVLGERGTGLSEGQMQRIAIARAIFSDNPILLLDEATSSLDENTEKRLLENIRKMTDKTVVIITHRPAALEICDSVINFERDDMY
ncbi:ABC transporter ATP-binding protein [Ruminococcus flavefaciens]|uniref:ABC transporter ATP-binding protein n=1 Tax=Ruminococcus flavefaciens TaxID=1265 RepID=UPI0006869AEA|nr:ABC transporter ATP-binding protein [Ruminococcus flavefaciens]